MDASEHPVRAFRKAQKPPMNLEVLAARIGTTKANLSRIENGKQELSIELLPRLVAETAIPARKLRPDLAKLFDMRRPPARGRTAA